MWSSVNGAKMQVARPFMSVGKLCDKGYEALFSADAAQINDPASKVEMCRFKWEHGVYVLDADLPSAEGDKKTDNSNPGFERPGN